MSLPNAPTLEVDLSALRANYHLLKDKHARHTIAAVVKANAYGLGMEGVSKALWEEGCREFFVATLSEGITLRKILPQAQIGVFNGIFPGEEKEYAAQRLMPVINDPSQARLLKGRDAIIHVDTGMTRLGVAPADVQPVASAVKCVLLMSHLACAYEIAHPQNQKQLECFKAARTMLPDVRASLSNSAACFHPQEFHFDVARTGCALYGISPIEGKNPMQPVVRLSSPILQLRNLDHDAMVGYDATYEAKKGTRIAIAGFGYADGFFRSLSNKGSAYINGTRAPIIGIISMDMLALDVSAIPEASLTAHTRIEFLNAEQTVDTIAEACATVGYEIFTRLGDRVKRIYA